MKKILLALVLFLLTQLSASAQGPIFLPLIFKDELPMKNGWSIISPYPVTNMVLNPSGEIAGNFAAVGAATVTRSTTYQKYGLNSYRVQTVANGQGIQLTLSTLTNATHYVTVRVKGKTPAQWGFSLSASPYIPAVFLENLGEGWSLYGLEFGANVASGKTFLRVGQLGPGSGDFYLDGIQVEAGGTWTTYCDGTQEGCSWNGPDHAASSTRSAESRAGGLVKDFYEDYGFFVEKIVGAGSTTQTLSVDEYALLPGGELNNIKTDPRQFTIIGKFIGSSEKDLHDKRQDLLELLSDESYPANQPIKIRFTGASVPKEIGAYYQGGLEGELNAFYCEFAPDEDNQWARLNQWVEKCGIQFQSPDPFWYEVGESAVSLDTNDSATFRLVAGRLKSTGQWSALGPPGAPGTAVYTGVYAIAEDATYVYFGGDFLNFDNIAAADYVVRYNKQTGAYSALGAGLNGRVWDMTIMPTGDLLIVGEFINAGGVAAADYITRWDGSAYNAVGVPVAGAAAITVVYGVNIDLSGDIIVTGVFTDFANVANADYIAMFDTTSTWVAVGNPNSGGAAITSIRQVAIDNQNRIWAVGQFTTLAGVAGADYIAMWNGTAWVSTGLTGGAITIIYSIDISNAGIIYIGGTLTGPWGNNITSYNGTSWNALGSGTNGTVRKIRISQDGIVYLSGVFTSAGGIALADYIAGWNGSSYFHLDANLPGAPVIYSILPSKYLDAVVPQKYDLWLGFDTTGTGNFAGKTTVSNGGTSPAFPKIAFNRSGGTTAVVETLKNERTGKGLLFNYGLQNGETLTVDLEPTQKSIFSSRFGLRLDAILANSDFGEWQLLPGNNDVTSFVNVSGAPTVTTSLLWRDKFKSWD